MLRLFASASREHPDPSVTGAELYALLLLTLFGCADTARAPVDAYDAGTDAAVHRTDAGRSLASTVDASVDLHFLVIATLLEMERSLVARCPCLTAAGEYESESQCRSALSLGSNWIDCANRVDLRSDDSDQTREKLRCNIEELSVRTECLTGSSCAKDAIAMCMTQSLGCPVPPYDLLSKVVSECTIALSR